MKKVFVLFCMLVSLVFASDSSFDEVLAKAKQGDAEAQFNLGVMYANGHGVRQDYKKAKEYFGLSCDSGFQLGCDAYRELNERGI